jgi:hypothetical protein
VAVNKPLNKSVALNKFRQVAMSATSNVDVDGLEKQEMTTLSSQIVNDVSEDASAIAGRVGNTIN